MAEKSELITVLDDSIGTICDVQIRLSNVCPVPYTSFIFYVIENQGLI